MNPDKTSRGNMHFKVLRRQARLLHIFTALSNFVLFKIPFKCNISISWCCMFCISYEQFFRVFPCLRTYEEYIVFSGDIGRYI